VSFLKDIATTKIALLPFAVAYLVGAPLDWLRRIRENSRVDSLSQLRTSLCIEAGKPGWNSIEFKELYSSACEFLGPDQVHKVVINKEENYLLQITKALDTIRPTHYVFDPRSGSQEWGLGLWQAFRLSFLFASRGIIPIALLADYPVRQWRTKTAVVTARRGLTVAFMPPRCVRSSFPHSRLIGPSLMPLSEETLTALNNTFDKRVEPLPPCAVFAGSLYEPRATILKAIKAGLIERGFDLDMRGRDPGAPRSPDSDYWARLINAPIVVTTADHAEAQGADPMTIRHLVYRYIEATACGTLLVAPAVPCIERYFTPGRHFVAFESVADAVDVIEYYLQNPEERARIANQGRQRAHALVRARTYWTSIDVALGKDSLT
jgi:hypothetical protein